MRIEIAFIHVLAKPFGPLTPTMTTPPKTISPSTTPPLLSLILPLFLLLDNSPLPLRLPIGLPLDHSPLPPPLCLPIGLPLDHSPLPPPLLLPVGLPLDHSPLPPPPLNDTPLYLQTHLPAGVCFGSGEEISDLCYNIQVVAESDLKIFL